MIAVFLLIACGVSEPVATPTPETVVFPHAEGYKAGALHGAESRQAGTATCLGCHRDDATAAPTCASCHQEYPHPEGWLVGTTHGAGMTGDTGEAARAPCLTCHGVPDLAAQSCTSCHASWPHPEGWELAGQHGQYVMARGSAYAACGSCHGATLAGTDTAPACASCHSGYPHTEGWRDPALHAAGDLTACQTCHGTLGTGGNAGVACSRCHATYPHPDGWRAGHLATVTQVGQGVCLDCHEEGSTLQIPAACGSSCHGGAP